MPKTLNNSLYQRIAIIIGIISTLSGGAFAIDSRYANAEEVEKQIVKIQSEQSIAIKKLEARFNRDAADRLRNEIFKLEFKKNESELKPLEAALLERYKRALKKIEDEEVK